MLADNKVSGFLIFRYLPTLQEASVPLQVQNSSTYTLPFDNTGGISTGIAMSTTSTTAINVQLTIEDDKGTLITTDTVALAPRGHA